MPDNTPEKPVFVDQTPEYQQAVQKIQELRKQPEAFERAVKELGLTKEWQANKAQVDALRPQAQTLLEDESAAINKRNMDSHRVNTTGSMIGGAIGLGAGMLALKRAGVVMASLIGVATAFAAKAVHRSVSLHETGPGFDTNIQTIQDQKMQLAMTALEKQKPFIELMATKMLSEQKELQGMGADMKLVSTREPVQEASMAAKYATAPAASNAAMVQSQKDAAQNQPTR